MLATRWQQCYTDTWQDSMVPEAFCHPAVVRILPGAYNGGMKTHQKLFQPCPKCGRTKNPRAKTCGLCAGKGRKDAPCRVVACVCAGCGSTFDMPEWRVNQGRGRFCSRPCVNAYLATVKGPAHAKYQGREAPVSYRGANWRAARAAVLARAEGCCESCGVDLSTVKRYAIHHHIGMHKFANGDDAHTPDNLSAICQSCHAKEHGLGKMPTKGNLPVGRM